MTNINEILLNNGWEIEDFIIPTLQFIEYSKRYIVRDKITHKKYCFTYILKPGTKECIRFSSKYSNPNLKVKEFFNFEKIFDKIKNGTFEKELFKKYVNESV